MVCFFIIKSLSLPRGYSPGDLVPSCVWNPISSSFPQLIIFCLSSKTPKFFLPQVFALMVIFSAWNALFLPDSYSSFRSLLKCWDFPWPSYLNDTPNPQLVFFSHGILVFSCSNLTQLVIMHLQLCGFVYLDCLSPPSHSLRVGSGGMAHSPVPSAWYPRNICLVLASPLPLQHAPPTPTEGRPSTQYGLGQSREPLQKWELRQDMSCSWSAWRWPAQTPQREAALRMSGHSSPYPGSVPPPHPKD